MSFLRGEVLCDAIGLTDDSDPSMSKAKRYGWFGFVDSYESILSVSDEFAQMKIIPDPKAIEPRG